MNTVLFGSVLFLTVHLLHRVQRNQGITTIPDPSKGRLSIECRLVPSIASLPRNSEQSLLLIVCVIKESLEDSR